MWFNKKEEEDDQLVWLCVNGSGSLVYKKFLNDDGREKGENTVFVCERTYLMNISVTD